MPPFRFRCIDREKPLAIEDGWLRATGPVKVFSDGSPAEMVQTVSGRTVDEARDALRRQMPGVEVVPLDEP